MRRSQATLAVSLVAVVLLVALVGSGGAAAPDRSPRLAGLLAPRAHQSAAETPSAAIACAPAWTTVASPDGSPTVNLLSAVSAVSDTDVWAVGHQLGASLVYKTLALHWDGSAWKLVSSANAGTGDNVLVGVAAVSSSDVWAVGSSTNANDVEQTLIEHWDGTAGTVAPSPNASRGTTGLWGVAAASAADVWAVGNTTTDAGAIQTLIEHWDGTAWSLVTSPDPSLGGSLLNGVTARPGDAWAVGYFSSKNANALQTLILHWNGTLWRVTRSPNAGTGQNNFLVDVASLSATDAWTVGYSDGAIQSLALAEHWDGRRWSIVANPASVPQDARLLAVA